MGRVIRRVPPGWKHPKREDGRYQPCFDEDFATAARRWKEEFAQWEAGTHPHHSEGSEFWEGWCHPPTRDCCRPAFTQEPTWWQVYENVSEGTPVTEPFPTREALIEHLVANGTDYDPPCSREAAEAFVRDGGYAPSMVSKGGLMKTGIDAAI